MEAYINKGFKQMSNKSNLLSGIEKVSEEVSSHDLEVNSGGGFITECGVYPVTIEKAFLSATKKGGVQFDIHFGGANMFNATLYIVSMKNGKKITTCQVKGKTVSLPDYKMFKQLMYLATGEGQALEEVNVKQETVSYKSFGKTINAEAETLVDLIGKEIQIGVRLEEDYNYEDGAVDKTQLKTNQNGDVVYAKKLESIFSKDGFDTTEILKGEETPKSIESKKKFFASDKAIKRVTLEEPEVDESDEEVEVDEEIDF